MDHGHYISASFITLLIWISCRAYDLEMGLRDRVYLWPCSGPSYCLLHERIVCLFSQFVSLVVWHDQFRVYHRSQSAPLVLHKSGFMHRFKLLIGISGIKNRKPEPSWSKIILDPINVIWRPQILLILLFEVLTYFSYGMHSCLTDHD